MKAFVLGFLSTTANLVESLTAIREEADSRNDTYVLYGGYDIISKTDTEAADGVPKLLGIMAKNGVLDTHTLIVDERLGLSFETKDCKDSKKCAYVFLKSKRPFDYKKWEAPLRSNTFITEAHATYGFYDAVLSVREEARKNFLHGVSMYLWSLREIGVIGTQALFTVEL
jgi:hypothetical protein